MVPTGTLGSMPKKGPATEELAGTQESLGLETPFKSAMPNPNFDPPFRNDVRLAERGFFKGIMHFVNKHENNLTRSIIDRVVSPLKFAGCVNNYSELRRRYRHLMDLEAAESSSERVRFVNYYTASTGHPKKEKKTKTPKERKGGKSSKESKHSQETDIDQSENQTETEDIRQIQDTTNSPPQESKILADSPLSGDSPPADDTPSLDKLSLQDQPLKPTSSHASHSSHTSMEPQKASIDASLSSSETGLLSPNIEEHEETLSLSENASITPSESSDPTKQPLRKFILLPSHHWKYNDNAHWVPILMENMDEVQAHQSMFIPQGANYDHLVGDSVGLIEQWIENDLSRRLLQEGLD